jgi:hypothetical protein
VSGQLCEVETTGRIWCRLPKGHHGKHFCGHVADCNFEWPNESSTEPCTSSTVAVLGVLGDPARVRCGLLDGHDGLHRFSMAWFTEQEGR